MSSSDSEQCAAGRRRPQGDRLSHAQPAPFPLAYDSAPYRNRPQVRDFARATGKLAKTDSIDAGVLARFAEAIRPPLRPLRDSETQTLNLPLTHERILLIWCSRSFCQLSEYATEQGGRAQVVQFCSAPDVDVQRKGPD